MTPTNSKLPSQTKEATAVPMAEDGQFSLDLFMSPQVESKEGVREEDVSAKRTAAAVVVSTGTQNTNANANANSVAFVMPDPSDAMMVFSLNRASTRTHAENFSGRTRRREQRDLVVGDLVVASSAGAGTITSFTSVGAPRVSEVAVSWLECADGTVYDPKRRRP